MKTWIAATALAAASAAALAQTLPGKEPPKPAAKAATRNGTANAASGPVATVNGVAVPQARLELLMRQQAQRGMPDNEQMRGMVREELINREVIAQEAQRSGLAKNAEVQTQMELVRQEVLVSAYIREWVRRNPITEADVTKEYERARQQAGEKEYKARHILLETEEDAKRVIAELNKGAKFEELATRSSKDPGSASRGGDLDWNVPGTFDRAFSDAMVKLDKGKYTQQPVQTRFGYHVIRLDDVRATSFPALSEVRERIQQQLVQARVETLVKSLRSKAKIE